MQNSVRNLHFEIYSFQPSNLGEIIHVMNRANSYRVDRM